MQRRGCGGPPASFVTYGRWTSAARDAGTPQENQQNSFKCRKTLCFPPSPLSIQNASIYSPQLTIAIAAKNHTILHGARRVARHLYHHHPPALYFYHHRLRRSQPMPSSYIFCLILSSYILPTYLSAYLPMPFYVPENLLATITYVHTCLTTM
jgi:hypothetical protein